MNSPEPEIIVLAALHLALAYLSDRPRSTSFWSQHISQDAFSVAAINATTRCILQDIDYGLHSFTPEMVAEAMEDMRRASAAVRLAEKPAETRRGRVRSKTRPPALSFEGLGEAVVWNGLMTPEPSPPC